MDGTGFALLQSILAAGSGVVMYLLWTAFRRLDVAPRIVAIGFAMRAIGGMVLVFVAWLDLPIAEGLRFHSGIWVFGSDGAVYYEEADRLLIGGGHGILSPDLSTPAYRYVQMLSVVRLALGTSLATAVMINLLAFLGTALVVGKWGVHVRRKDLATVALAGLSLQPSFVLWATQPLKDTVLGFLIVLFVFVAHLLRESVTALAFTRMVLHVCMLAVVDWLLLGVRPEYRVPMWTAFVLAACWMWIWNIMEDRDRAGRKAFATGLVLVCVVAAAFATGFAERMGTRAMVVFEDLHESRVKFVRNYDASTAIEPGPLIDWIPYGDVLGRGFMAFLPRFVTYPLGLANAEGGRGLWWFAELDTVVFGALVIAVLRLLWVGRVAGFASNPTFVFVALLFLGALPIFYTVNNFGTLMRFRMMLEIPLLLLPLALGSTRASGVDSGDSASIALGDSAVRRS